MRWVLFSLALGVVISCKKEPIQIVTPEIAAKPNVKSMLYQKWRVDTITSMTQNGPPNDSIWDIQYLSPPKVYIQQCGYNENPELYGKWRDFEMDADSQSFRIWFFIGYTGSGSVELWWDPKYYIDFLSQDSMAVHSFHKGLSYEFSAVE
jgi:hypothetical protein